MTVRATFCACDVLSDESVDAAFAKARAAQGQERVLVCCAGGGNAIPTARRDKATGAINIFPSDNNPMTCSSILSHRLELEGSLGSWVFVASKYELYGGGAQLRPMHRAGKLAGPAITVKAPPGDNLMLHKAIDMAVEGDVIVVKESFF